MAVSDHPAAIQPADASPVAPTRHGRRGLESTLRANLPKLAAGLLGLAFAAQAGCVTVNPADDDDSASGDDDSAT